MSQNNIWYTVWKYTLHAFKKWNCPTPLSKCYWRASLCSVRHDTLSVSPYIFASNFVNSTNIQRIFMCRQTWTHCTYTQWKSLEYVATIRLKNIFNLQMKFVIFQLRPDRKQHASLFNILVLHRKFWRCIPKEVHLWCSLLLNLKNLRILTETEDMISKSVWLNLLQDGFLFWREMSPKSTFWQV